jgi:hypothetical protein
MLHVRHVHEISADETTTKLECVLSFGDDNNTTSDSVCVEKRLRGGGGGHRCTNITYQFLLYELVSWSFCSITRLGNGKLDIRDLSQRFESRNELRVMSLVIRQAASAESDDVTRNSYSGFVALRKVHINRNLGKRGVLPNPRYSAIA